MIKIAVLVSGNGTNMQSLIDNCNSGYIPAKIVLVISNKNGVQALDRAKNEKIESLVIEKKNFEDKEEYSARILKEVQKRNIDLICLAGFLLQLGSNIVCAYKKRILNIHPALLPDFGGKGMYGIKVHKAVLESVGMSAAGKKYSGCTVHFVDEEYDHGSIIIQKKVKIADNETAESLSAKILKEEHKLYSEAVKKIISISKYMGKIENNKY